MLWLKNNNLGLKICKAILTIVIPFSFAYGQQNETIAPEMCSERFSPADSTDFFPHSVIISNNTDTVIKFLLHFEDNGFFDELSLTQKLLEGIENYESTEEKQLKILDNIAGIIKSPAHRNFNLLFSSVNPGTINKMYSPLVMLSSFYDKQCHNFQRLAAQMAILTPFFTPNDFLSCHIENHNILNIKIGDKFVFHDFDPGQPGYRFAKDSLNFASFNDLLRNYSLIDEKQFYLYNDIMLSPWIPHKYYASLLKNNYGCFAYKDLEQAYSFVPNWVLPPNATIITDFPDTSVAAAFGAILTLDSNALEVKNAFEKFDKYLTGFEKNDSLLVNEKIKAYLKTNFAFDYDINYVYLIKNKLLRLADSTYVSPVMPVHYLVLEVETQEDTLFFLDDFFIPLALHQLIVDKGLVYITETDITLSGTEEFIYIVEDTLTFSLYNLSPPITTSFTERKPFDYNSQPLIFGPSVGYISPQTKARFKFYYNPYYYSFHKQDFTVKYLSGCDNTLRIKLQ